MSPVNTSAARKIDWIEPSAATSQGTLETTAPIQHGTRRDIRHVLIWYALTDALALLAGFIFAWGLSSTINNFFFDRPVINLTSEYGPVRVSEFMLIAAAILAWFQHTDHYRSRMSFWQENQKIVTALGVAMMADGFLQFAVKESFSRLWLMSGWIIAAVVMIGLRNVLRGYFRRQGRFQVRTLLVGSGETARQTRAALQSEPGLGFEIAFQVKDLATTFLQAGNSWETLCNMHGVDYVMIALDGSDLAAAEEPLAQLARESVPFSIAPPLGHLPVIGMVPQYFFNHDVLLLARSSDLERPLPCVMKRTLDVLVAGAALIAVSPVMLAIAIAVKSDGGPALFGHSRLGRNGKSFSCLKFRSMVMNGDAVLERHLAENPAARQEWQASRKLQNDPRVTRIGDFLRRSSLDELPQLINVLRGDMSLVGPRPIVTAEVDKYEGDIAHYYRVRPGVTGLWQVSGRSDVSYPQRVHMDSWYVRNWSLWHDIAILCKTVPALLKRSGAY
jgi:Undecaprenyl-phosphate galactose phosphotransferase WbaP